MGDTPLRSADVSVAVLNYNGMRVLAGCLESIRALKNAPAEVMLVDDGSTDGSPEWVRENHPDVRVFALPENTKRLNVVRNTALREARGRFVLLVDNDVALAEDCLDQLLHHLGTLPDAAVCMPRALLAHDPSLIYQDGQHLHYVGASYALHRGMPVAELHEQPRVSVGWGVQLIDRQAAAACGDFNEAYVMGWGDDGEFNHKMNLSGRLCYHVPSAVVLHHRTEGARRYYGTIRNRLRFMLECYAARTLLLAAPGLLLYEVALLGFLTLDGALGQYLRGVRDALADLPAILRERRRVHARRKLRDSQLLTNGPIFISPEYVQSRWVLLALKTVNGALDLHWSLIRRWL